MIALINFSVRAGTLCLARSLNTSDFTLAIPRLSYAFPIDTRNDPVELSFLVSWKSFQVTGERGEGNDFVIFTADLKGLQDAKFSFLK